MVVFVVAVERAAFLAMGETRAVVDEAYNTSLVVVAAAAAVAAAIVLLEKGKLLLLFYMSMSGSSLSVYT